ncbi:MAG: L-lactate dehydrogenase [Clostridiales bacterium]|nr:L-lactate dehydrogenase [Clostridiales bacterium]
MVKSKVKVAIIGTGFVGSSIAFEMAIKGLVSEMVLIDVNKAKAFGEAMDINHGLSFVGQMSIYSGDYQDCKDCDCIIITAGAGRKPGETRLDLAKKNTSIIKDITKNVIKYYNQGVILVVSNPLDIITYMFRKWSSLPASKVFGSGTVLDSSRFRYLLSQKFNMDVRNVHGYIIGEHGDSQIPVWSAVNVAGMRLGEYCSIYNNPLCNTDKDEIAKEVKEAGATIIKNKGATYYAIAMTVNRIVEAIIKNQNSILTVSSVINGLYGINDVALSMPCIINSNGIDRVLEITLDDLELKELKTSAEKIKEVLKQVEDI